MLFVGGPKDGYIGSAVSGPSIVVSWPTETHYFDLEFHTYTRRTYYNNDRSYKFTVMALESMKGHEVLAMLASKYYPGNPLYIRGGVRTWRSEIYIDEFL